MFHTPWRHFVEGTVVIIASIVSVALANRCLTKRGWTTEEQKTALAIGIGILALVMLITNRHSGPLHNNGYLWIGSEDRQK